MASNPAALQFLFIWSLILAGALISSLVARVITKKNFLPRLWVWFAIIGLVFASINFGKWPFFVLTAGVFMASFWEISRMAGTDRLWKPFLALFLALPWLALAQTLNWGMWIPAAFILFFIASVYLVFFLKKKNPWNIFLFALILGTGFSFWIMMGRQDGARLVIFVFSITAINDILAFFFGMLLGRLRLFPRISPNKTIAGYLGGILFAVGAAHIFRFAVPELNAIQVTVTGLLLALFGSAGDLLASRVKRIYNVKDFSSMLGLMGGMLDRCDSLLSTGWICSFLFIYFF